MDIQVTVCSVKLTIAQYVGFLCREKCFFLNAALICVIVIIVLCYYYVIVIIWFRVVLTCVCDSSLG